MKINLKKIFMFLCFFMVTLSLLPIETHAQDNSIRIFVYGKEVYLKSQPYVKANENGKFLMLPINEIIEYLPNCKIKEWSSVKQAITYTLENIGTEVTYVAGNPMVETVNFIYDYYLGIQPEMKGYSLMVPHVDLDYFTQNEVIWYEKEGKVSINKKDTNLSSKEKEISNKFISQLKSSFIPLDKKITVGDTILVLANFSDVSNQFIKLRYFAKKRIIWEILNTISNLEPQYKNYVVLDLRMSINGKFYLDCRYRNDIDDFHLKLPSQFKELPKINQELTRLKVIMNGKEITEVPVYPSDNLIPVKYVKNIFKGIDIQINSELDYTITYGRYTIKPDYNYIYMTRAGKFKTIREYDENGDFPIRKLIKSYEGNYYFNINTFLAMLSQPQMEIRDNKIFINMEDAPELVVNGVFMKKDYVKLVLENGRTLVPFRYLFEFFEADVKWDSSTKTVTGNLKDKEIKLIIGETTAYVNGVPIELDVPAMINDNKTYVPIRFVSESVGAKVLWDQETYCAFVWYNKPSIYLDLSNYFVKDPYLLEMYKKYITTENTLEKNVTIIEESIDLDNYYYLFKVKTSYLDDIFYLIYEYNDGGPYIYDKSKWKLVSISKDESVCKKHILYP